MLREESILELLGRYFSVFHLPANDYQIRKENFVVLRNICYTFATFFIFILPYHVCLFHFHFHIRYILTTRITRTCTKELHRQWALHSEWNPFPVHSSTRILQSGTLWFYRNILHYIDYEMYKNYSHTICKILT